MVGGGRPCAVALLVARTSAVARAVGLAFAVAASTFCPLLVLGIWWRGLTAVGALAGLLVGGGSRRRGPGGDRRREPAAGWFGALLAQPALWTVPLAFATMIGVSLLTRDRLPAHLARTMVRLHAPEALDLDRGGFLPRPSDPLTARRRSDRPFVAM